MSQLQETETCKMTGLVIMHLLFNAPFILGRLKIQRKDPPHWREALR